MSALPAAAGGIAVSRALRVVAGRSEAREDLLAFTGRMYPGYQAAPHHRRIAEALEAVERGDTRRLIVTLPPRHGKSLLASQHFPAWFLGRGPDRRIIACSYAASLAYRFSRLARNLLSEPGWPWPEVRTASDLAQVQRWDIAGRRGGYIAAGVGGGITG
ncbi:MAG: terminase, partial [Chloroflexota bacterium]